MILILTNSEYECNSATPEQDIALPFPQNVITDTLGSTEEYMTMWKNRAGSVSYLPEPSSMSPC